MNRVPKPKIGKIVCTTKARAGRRAALDGCADDGDVIMDMLRQAGLNAESVKDLTVTDRKDGIDIARPSYALLRFVEIVRHNARLDRQKESHD